MCCCRWYLDQVVDVVDLSGCSKEVCSDIDRYCEFLDQLIEEYERDYSKVDADVFGWLINNLGDYEVGYRQTMPANLLFLCGPTTYAWTGTSFLLVAEW
jgi:hypothetical protein